MKAFHNLVKAEDDEIEAAYDHFHKMVGHEEGAVRNATLAEVVRIGEEGNATHTDVKESLAIGGHIEQNIEAIVTSTGRADLYMKSMLVS